MSRSVNARGVVAALCLALFGAGSVQAQVAPAVIQAAATQRLAVTAGDQVQQVLGGPGIGATLTNRLVASRTGADTTRRPSTPNVFGTVSLPMGLQPKGARWAKVMTAPLDQPALIGLTRPAGGLSAKEKVAFVQSAVTAAVHNRAPAAGCADDGYWAAADETLKRGVGDCVDIVIAKMEALRLLGIPEQDLYLTTGVVGGGTGGGQGSEAAALLVRIDDAFWLLPEGFAAVVEAGGASSGSTGFDPRMTYGVGANWVHGRRITPAAG